MAEVEPKTLSYIITDLRNKERDLRGALKIYEHPMPVRLSEKFPYLKCPAALCGANREAGRDKRLH